jgi:hypothetical protein
VAVIVSIVEMETGIPVPLLIRNSDSGLDTEENCTQPSMTPGLTMDVQKDYFVYGLVMCIYLIIYTPATLMIIVSVLVENVTFRSGMYILKIGINSGMTGWK